MSEFLEPQQESAAVCENRDIGPYRNGPKLMTTILYLAYLQKSGFGSTQKVILKVSQDPANMRCQY